MEMLYKDELVKKLYELIDSSEKYLYIVSPYINLWEEVYLKLKNLREKKVDIIIITRDDNTRNNNSKREFMASVDELKILGIKTCSIQQLHAKIFLNEKTAIIGSINMTWHAFSESEEIGGITESDKEYNMVHEILETRIKPIINTLDGNLEDLKNKINNEIRNNIKNIYMENDRVFVEHNKYRLQIYMDRDYIFQNAYNICIELESKEKINLINKNIPKIKDDVFYLVFKRDGEILKIWYKNPFIYSNISSLLDVNFYEFKTLVNRLTSSIEKLLISS
jgi:HKD family nuclease